MPVSDTLYSHPEIITSIRIAYQEVADFVESISEEEFLQERGEKWSIAQNLDHLLKSTQPLVKALRLPKLTFRSFGKPNRPTRTYQELVKRYHERLAAAGTIDNPFSADKKPEFSKEKMLAEWKAFAEKLAKGIGKWSEKDLDNYLMPHPLLGKLLVREMLFFTIYHTGHHLKAMKMRLAGQ